MELDRNLQHLRTAMTNRQTILPPTEEAMTMWQTPEYTELRYGFEITMYICNR